MPEDDIQLYRGSQFKAIVRVVGDEAAAILCRHFAGRDDLRIPKGLRNPPSPLHLELVELIGKEAARRLMAEFGALKLSFPTRVDRPYVKAKIMALLTDTPLAPKQIARQLGITERYVRKVRSLLREERSPRRRVAKQR